MMALTVFDGQTLMVKARKGKRSGRLKLRRELGALPIHRAKKGCLSKRDGGEQVWTD